MAEIAKPAEIGPGDDQLTQLPLPHLVFNAAAISMSASEVSAVLSFGLKPLTMLIMPPAIAKSFANQILNSIKDFEDQTGTTVLSVEEIREKLQARKRESR